MEASRRLDAETWSDPDVARRLSEATVALRLDWRSPDGVSFLAIYPAFQVPTIYLIAPLTGQPLGILLGFVTPQQFLAKLDECCAALSRPPTSMTESTTPPPQEFAPMDTTTTATSPREPEEGVPNTNRAPPPSEAPAMPQPLSGAEVAAQKERLLERIAEVKRQKEAQEKQARAHVERERELARRQNGKAAQETMKTIEEINKRKELEQRRREQSEAERHKAQVREKIRRDREIRAQQQQQQAGPSPAAPLPSTVTTAATATSPSAAAAAAAATSAAIAFRMPDGSVEKADFAASSTLADCRKHLRTVVGVKGPFTLMTNFPRHVFADEEYALSLRDLQLCPSATLILTGATEYASSAEGAAGGEAESTGGGTGLISSVTSYLWGFFSSSPAAPPDHQQQQASAASTTSASGRVGGRPYGGGGGGAGNVHGLRRDDMEGDEDNAYWNGNSTQQY